MCSPLITPLSPLSRVVKIAALKRDWDAALPSRIEAETGSLPSKVTWDDTFVEEMKRTIKACKLFLFLPIFNMADTGLNTPQGAMGAAMTTNGAPNDLLNNFNQICIIALIRAFFLQFLFTYIYE